MTNKDSYIKTRRNYKNKNMRYEMILMDCFNFSYAGKCNIFISYSRIKKKYQVIVSGVHFVEDIFLFTPHYSKRYEYDSLYSAILSFNIFVKSLVISGLDWYSPDNYSLDNIYNEITVVD